MTPLVLDLCGGTGAWSKPYADDGYAVEVVDPLCDGRDVRLLQRIAVPVRGILGPPRLTFYQWEYGDPGHKPTCIWGSFVVPAKQPKPRTKPSTWKTKAQNAEPWDAITPAGFARAFYELNK